MLPNPQTQRTEVTVSVHPLAVIQNNVTASFCNFVAMTNNK
jgi:hypothetical protein